RSRDLGIRLSAPGVPPRHRERGARGRRTARGRRPTQGPRRERDRRVRPAARDLSAPLTFYRPLDVARMRRERHARLVDAMTAEGVDALVLLGQPNVTYATGLR